MKLEKQHQLRIGVTFRQSGIQDLYKRVYLINYDTDECILMLTSVTIIT